MQLACPKSCLHMIRTLRAIEFCRPMEVGSKNPALFLCQGASEPEDVVVKFREILLRQKFSCVGETIAALLAGDLGFYRAEPVIVELDRELAMAVENSIWPDYAERIIRSSGLNYGSVFVGPGTDARLPASTDSRELRAVWAELFCFDFLIQNYDRVAKNPNYLREGDSVILMDHEQALGHLDDGKVGEFSVESLSLDPFFRHVAFLTFDSTTDFRPFFRRLANLQTTQISGYFAEVPAAWTDRRSVRLEQYLLWAKDHASGLCEALTTILRP